MENHYIHMDNKQEITVSAVASVEAFDEETILANLAEEGLVICGHNLHIETLDLEDGRLVARGEIESVSYTKKKNRPKLFDRFKK